MPCIPVGAFLSVQSCRCIPAGAPAGAHLPRVGQAVTPAARVHCQPAGPAVLTDARVVALWALPLCLRLYTCRRARAGCRGQHHVASMHTFAAVHTLTCPPPTTCCLQTSRRARARRRRGRPRARRKERAGGEAHSGRLLGAAGADSSLRCSSSMAQHKVPASATTLQRRLHCFFHPAFVLHCGCQLFACNLPGLSLWAAGDGAARQQQLSEQDGLRCSRIWNCSAYNTTLCGKHHHSEKRAWLVTWGRDGGTGLKQGLCQSEAWAGVHGQGTGVGVHAGEGGIEVAGRSRRQLKTIKFRNNGRSGKAQKRASRHVRKACLQGQAGWEVHCTWHALFAVSSRLQDI